MLIFLQARSSSNRFPRKVMAPLLGMPMILFQIQRILLAKFDFRLVVLTSSEQSDDELSSILQNAGIEVFRGDLIDVNRRFRQALEYLEISQGYFIRITADCPLLCLDLLEYGLEEVMLHEWDYFSNTVIRTFPDGLDFEIVSIPRFIAQNRSKFDQSRTCYSSVLQKFVKILYWPVSLKI
jgi:spore coat polysaccharide biosynthesis protein SpsF